MKIIKLKQMLNKINEEKINRLFSIKLGLYLGMAAFFVLLQSNDTFAQEAERKIHPQYLQASQSFKSKVGQNRVAEFNAIESSLTTFIASADPKPSYDYFIGDFQITTSELVTLLGQPDVKISNGIWVYVLNPSLNCKVLVGIDPNGYLSYITRKECN
jgi:hypothetical protein